MTNAIGYGVITSNQWDTAPIGTCSSVWYYRWIFLSSIAITESLGWSQARDVMGLRAQIWSNEVETTYGRASDAQAPELTRITNTTYARYTHWVTSEAHGSSQLQLTPIRPLWSSSSDMSIPLIRDYDCSSRPGRVNICTSRDLHCILFTQWAKSYLDIIILVSWGDNADSFDKPVINRFALSIINGCSLQNSDVYELFRI